MTFHIQTRLFLAFILLFTLFSTSYSYYEYDVETNDLLLTGKDFHDAIKDHQYLLVNFHALWCKYSKQLMPEWIKVSKVLLYEPSIVKVARVEAYDEKDLAQEYKIDGFPTIKLFIDQVPHDYNHGSNSFHILEFVHRKTQHPLSEQSSASEIERLLTEYEWIGILFGGENENIIKSVAFNISDVLFVKTFSDDIKQKYNQTDGAFVLVNNITHSYDVFNGTFSEDKITAFIKEKKFPIVPRFSQGTAEKIFYGDEPAMILIRKKDKDGDDAEVAFQKASESIGTDIFMTVASYDEELGRLLCRNLGIEESEIPTVRIIKPEDDRIFKYYFEEEITQDTTIQFYEDYKNKKAKRFYLSELVPNENDDLVKKVVGKTFKELVFDDQTDVLLLIYTPWCGHCVALNPIYDNVARKMHDVENFLVAKIDASENDLDAFGLEVFDFPTILFFGRGKKDDPADLLEDRTEYTFDTFIRNYATVGLEKMKGPNPFDKNEL